MVYSAFKASLERPMRLESDTIVSYKILYNATRQSLSIGLSRVGSGRSNLEQLVAVGGQPSAVAAIHVISVELALHPLCMPSDYPKVPNFGSQLLVAD